MSASITVRIVVRGAIIVASLWVALWHGEADPVPSGHKTLYSSGMVLAHSPETILIYVGGDLVGDGVMKLAFLRALRATWPGARITWLAGKHSSTFAHALAPLVAGLLDEVIEEAGFDRPLRFLAGRPLAGRRFDLIIDTQRGVNTTLLLRRISHDCFISSSAGFFLSDIRPPPPYRHPPALVGQMLELVALASGRTPPVGAPLQLAPPVRDAACDCLPDGPVYVGLAPGAGGRHKCWPLENFIALAQSQVRAGRTPVFVTGPNEADWLDRLLTEVPGAVLPARHGAPAEIRQSVAFTIAVAARLAASVANDSGTGHMIAAADTPLVSLFGPTAAAKFAATTPQLTVIEATTFGGREMAAIPVDAVEAALDKLI